jgi:hypothetical protein
MRFAKLTSEDRLILDRLPVRVMGTYRYGDREDAERTLTRLRVVGSVVEAVCIDEVCRPSARLSARQVIERRRWRSSGSVDRMAERVDQARADGLL